MYRERIGTQTNMLTILREYCTCACSHVLTGQRGRKKAETRRNMANVTHSCFQPAHKSSMLHRQVKPCFAHQQSVCGQFVFIVLFSDEWAWIRPLMAAQQAWVRKPARTLGCLDPNQHAKQRATRKRASFVLGDAVGDAHTQG